MANATRILPINDVRNIIAIIVLTAIITNVAAAPAINGYGDLVKRCSIPLTENCQGCPLPQSS